MGVSGSGKSTIGDRLSRRLGCSFYDGDRFHTPENIEKMSRGIPLNDRDRYPWLEKIRNLMTEISQRQETAVIACSALKESYRQFLTQDQHQTIVWVYLKGSYEQIQQRMMTRVGHYMKAQMLRSQLETLEEPQDALILDISLAPETICDRIVAYLEG
jgi:gluconokinase